MTQTVEPQDHMPTLPPAPQGFCYSCYVKNTKVHRSSRGLLLTYCEHAGRGALLQLRQLDAGWRVYPEISAEDFWRIAGESALLAEPPANSQST